MLLIPQLTFAEGQWAMAYFFWTLGFIAIYALWIIGAYIILWGLTKLRNKTLSNPYRILFWAFILFAAYFHWYKSIYNPHPQKQQESYPPIEQKDTFSKYLINDSVGQNN
jgi:hypothetical protein